MNYSFFNLVSALVLSIIILFGWQYFYEKPRLVKDQIKKTITIYHKEKNIGVNSKVLNRNEALKLSKRVPIKSNTLLGSISLEGLRFDDLTLLNYRASIDKNSSAVTLFSPSCLYNSYFAEIGWLGNSNKTINLPNSSTLWKSNGSIISPGKPVTFSWTNPAKVTFFVEVEVDNNYMFTIKQKTVNQSSDTLQIQCYALINRNYNSKSERVINVFHQGMIGVINGELKEYTYDDIKGKKKQNFIRSKVNWLGITDKYWLAAFIPDYSQYYSSNFAHSIKSGMDKYQADFISNAKVILSGESFELKHKLFAGAKKVDLLDKYEKEYNVKLFDRAIDFGWFYVLTKPIFNAMNFFYLYVGNFGISIMIVTIIIKLAMFTLANKSYRSIRKIKDLQPRMEHLKEVYKTDNSRLNQEIINLYKKERVNPISGCLPLLIQIPVFFSIYKVLCVTIEMRHAPFLGWIYDLSAPDPTNVFNFFGLLPFTPSFSFKIGAWPIIMALTMYLQQKMTSYQQTDPIQAKVIKFMPIMFLFMFNNFPVGLLIYWSWNNILSIVQQFYINRFDKNA